MNQEYKEKLSRKIENQFSSLEERIMKDIVRRIRQAGEITSTADWQINRLRILGNSSEDIEKMLKDALNASYPEMFELYDQVIDWEYVRNRDIYEQINASFIPFEENAQLQQLTDSIIRQTRGELENITQSLGFYLDYGGGNRVLTPLAQVYQGYLDAACMDIVSGAFDYNSVLRRVVTQMTNSGLRTVDYASGRAYRVNVSARMAVMTGITQLTGHISDYNAETLGTEYFEIAWHAGARPTHQVWQGKVWSRQELVTVCGLGTVTGLEGVNCYHERYPFFPGLSERNWSDEWLEQKNREENTPREFQGKKYTVYEAKQKQRQMETAMMAQREKVQLLQEGKADWDDIMIAQAKYQGQLDEYSRFSRKMGLVEERERIYLDGRGRVAPYNLNYLEVSDTTDKWAKDAKDELLRSEKSLKNKKNEILEVYDANGNYVMTKRGGANSVRLRITDYLKLKGAVVTHNHPSGGSFSVNDIKFLKNTLISELRVSTQNYVYYIRKPEKWPKAINSSEKIEKAFSEIKNQLKPKYQKLYNEGVINKTQRHQLLSAEVNLEFAKRYGLEYGRETYK